jgi:hypothetical protein
MTIPGEDEILACTNLIGRTGARNITLGYLNHNVPVAEADWWASAQYQGAHIKVEHHTSPVEACRALTARVLTGAKCRCGRLVALSLDGAIAFNGTLVDGSTWTVEQARKAGQCLWQRRGKQWDSSCPEPKISKCATCGGTGHCREKNEC